MFAHQREIRTMTQGAILTEIARSKLRRLLARSKPPERTDVRMGDSVFFYKSAGRKNAPMWRGPALALEPDKARATENF